MSLLARLKRLPAQLVGDSPFSGTLRAERLPTLATALAAARHCRTPLRILDHVFRDGGDLKYLDVPGFPAVLFVRDPDLIRAVTVDTANRGDFDRDTLPTQGIARVVGGTNLLFARGEAWRKHRAAAARVFGAGTFQTPELYRDMEQAIRRAAEPQVEELARLVRASPSGRCRVRLEPDIQAVMLNVLVNVLFGSDVPHHELRARYLPAIAGVIRYILVDTVANQMRVPVFRIPALTRRHGRLKHDRGVFEELVDRVLATRSEGAGFWPLLTADGPEEAIRSNVRVFLAGALEATSSYLSWAIVNLARHPEAQARAHEEAARTPLTPEGRAGAEYLQQVLAESLRLNNALYFLPRVAVRDTTLRGARGWLGVPAGTHVVLATYHMNRCESHWGVGATGYPAGAFAPQRWDAANMAARGRSTKDNLHFGFGHGPRVCIGKHFSEAEAFVCLALFLRRFEFRAAGGSVRPASGVSTRPADGVDVELTLRFW
jgi:cytochrome P450